MRVGDLGGLAQGTGDVAVDPAQEGDYAEGDGDDGAVRELVRYILKTEGSRYESLPIVLRDGDSDHCVV